MSTVGTGRHGVYTPLRERRLALAVLASGLVGAIVDSVVFLLLAFGNLAYIEGLIVGKLWASVAAFGLLVARHPHGRCTRANCEAKRMGALALNVLVSPMLHARRGDIVERAATLRLPAFYEWLESAEASGRVADDPRIHQL